jgi:hypothetical protein
MPNGSLVSHSTNRPSRHNPPTSLWPHNTLPRSLVNTSKVYNVEEFGHTADDILAQAPAVASIDPLFMGPSLCCERQGFLLPDVIGAGWLDQHRDTISAITVQNYPENNCGVSGVYTQPQDVFYRYLNHTSAEWLTAQYTDVAQYGLEYGKELVMMEMNTASCGGFAGLSDSFGAAMW